jgi:hypothetical protein
MNDQIPESEFLEALKCGVKRTTDLIGRISDYRGGRDPDIAKSARPGDRQGWPEEEATPLLQQPLNPPRPMQAEGDALLTAIAKARAWIDDIRLGRLASSLPVRNCSTQYEAVTRSWTPVVEDTSTTNEDCFPSHTVETMWKCYNGEK